MPTKRIARPSIHFPVIFYAYYVECKISLYEMSIGLGYKDILYFFGLKLQKMQQSFFFRYPTNNSICYFFSGIDCLAKHPADEKRKTNGKTSAYTTLTCTTHVFFRMHHQYGEILPKVAFLFLFFCIFTR